MLDTVDYVCLGVLVVFGLAWGYYKFRYLRAKKEVKRLKDKKNSK